MADHIVSYYLRKQNMNVPAQSILQDSVLLASVFEELEPNILANVPAFNWTPSTQDHHSLNFELLTKLVQSLGVPVDGFLTSIEATVDCLVESLVLHTDYENQNGFIGLRKFMTHVLEQFNMAFNNQFSNNVVQYLLYYAYAYEANSTVDYDNFAISLEKDKIPCLFDPRAENEQNNFYECAFIYKLVTENGRPMYMLRQLHESLKYKAAADTLQAKYLELQSNIAGANAVMMEQINQIEQLDKRQIVFEQLEVFLDQLTDKQNLVSSDVLHQMQQLVQTSMDLQVLEEKGVSGSAQEEVKIGINDFICQYKELFKDNREAQYKLFDCCGMLEGLELLRTVISQVETEIDQKIRSFKSRVDMQSVKLDGEVSFIQNIHQLFVDNRNLLSYEYTKELVQMLKLFINQNFNGKYQIEDTVNVDSAVSDQHVAEQIKAFAIDQVRSGCKEFIREYLDVEFGELVNLFNSEQPAEDKKPACHEFSANKFIYSKLIDVVEDQQLLERFRELESISDLVNDELGGMQLSGFKFEYQKYAIECYDDLVRLFEQAKGNLINTADPSSHSEVISQRDYQLELDRIIDGQQPSMVPEFSYEDLNQIINKTTEFTYFINGLQVLHLQSIQRVDLTSVDRQIDRLIQINREILQNNEQPQEDGLNLVHIEMLRHIINEINMTQTNNTAEEVQICNAGSMFLQRVVEIIEVELIDLTRLSEAFRAIEAMLCKVDSTIDPNGVKKLHEDMQALKAQVYNCAACKLDQQCPVVERRFYELFDLVLRQIFKTNIGCQLNLILFKLVYKLFGEYNELAVNVQLTNDRVERMLATTMECTFIIRQAGGPLKMLVEYCNGYVISEYIVSLPVGPQIEGIQVVEAGHYDIIALLGDCFAGKLSDDMLRRIESQAVTVRQFDEDAVNELINEEYAKAHGNHKLLQLAVQALEKNQATLKEIAEMDDDIEFVTRYMDEVKIVCDQFTSLSKEKGAYVSDLDTMKEAKYQEIIKEEEFLETNYERQEVLDLARPSPTAISSETVAELLDEVHEAVCVIEDKLNELIRQNETVEMSAQSQLLLGLELRLQLFNLDYLQRHVDDIADCIEAENENLSTLTGASITQGTSYIEHDKTVLETRASIQCLIEQITKRFDECQKECGTFLQRDEAVQRLQEVRVVSDDFDSLIAQVQNGESKPIKVINNVASPFKKFIDELLNLSRLRSESGHKEAQIGAKAAELKIYLHTFVEELVEQLESFTQTVVQLRNYIINKNYTFRQYNDYLTLRQLSAELEKYIDYLLIFAQRKPLIDTLSKSSVPEYRVFSSLGLTLEKCELLSCSGVIAELKQIEADLELIEEDTVHEYEHVKDMDVAKLYLMEDIVVEVQAQKQHFLVTNDLIVNKINRFADNKVEERILQENSAKYNEHQLERLGMDEGQPLSYYEENGIEEDEVQLLLPGGAEFCKNILKYQEDFIRYYREVVEELEHEKLLVQPEEDSEVDGNQSIHRQLEELGEQIYSIGDQIENRELIVDQLAAQIINSNKMVGFSESYDIKFMKILNKLANINLDSEVLSMESVESDKEKINGLLDYLRNNMEDQVKLREKVMYCSGKMYLPFNLAVLITQVKLIELDQREHEISVYLGLVQSISATSSQLVSQELEDAQNIMKESEEYADKIPPKQLETPDGLAVVLDQLEEFYSRLMIIYQQVAGALLFISSQAQQFGVIIGNSGLVNQLNSSVKCLASLGELNMILGWLTDSIVKYSKMASDINGSDHAAAEEVYSERILESYSKDFEIMLAQVIAILGSVYKVDRDTEHKLENAKVLLPFSYNHEYYDVVSEEQLPEEIKEAFTGVYDDQNDIQIIYEDRANAIRTELQNVQEYKEMYFEQVNTNQVSAEIQHFKRFFNEQIINVVQAVRALATTDIDELIDNLVTIEVLLVKNFERFKNTVDQLLSSHIELIGDLDVYYQLFDELDYLEHSKYNDLISLQGSVNQCVDYIVSIMNYLADIENIQMQMTTSQEITQVLLKHQSERSQLQENEYAQNQQIIEQLVHRQINNIKKQVNTNDKSSEAGQLNERLAEAVASLSNCATMLQEVAVLRLGYQYCDKVEIEVNKFSSKTIIDEISEFEQQLSNEFKTRMSVREKVGELVTSVSKVNVLQALELELENSILFCCNYDYVMQDEKMREKLLKLNYSEYVDSNFGPVNSMAEKVHEQTETMITSNGTIPEPFKELYRFMTEGAVQLGKQYLSASCSLIEDFQSRNVMTERISSDVCDQKQYLSRIDVIEYYLSELELSHNQLMAWVKQQLMQPDVVATEIMERYQQEYKKMDDQIKTLLDDVSNCVSYIIQIKNETELPILRDIIASVLQIYTQFNDLRNLLQAFSFERTVESVLIQYVESIESLLDESKNNINEVISELDRSVIAEDQCVAWELLNKLRLYILHFQTTKEELIQYALLLKESLHTVEFAEDFADSNSPRFKILCDNYTRFLEPRLCSELSFLLIKPQYREWEYAVLVERDLRGFLGDYRERMIMLQEHPDDKFNQTVFAQTLRIAERWLQQLKENLNSIMSSAVEISTPIMYESTVFQVELLENEITKQYTEFQTVSDQETETPQLIDECNDIIALIADTKGTVIELIETQPNLFDAVAATTGDVGVQSFDQIVTVQELNNESRRVLLNILTVALPKFATLQAAGGYCGKIQDSKFITETINQLATLCDTEISKVNNAITLSQDGTRETEFFNSYIQPANNSFLLDCFCGPVEAHIREIENYNVYNDTDGVRMAYELFNEGLEEENDVECQKAIDTLIDYISYINYRPVMASDLDNLMHNQSQFAGVEWRFYSPSAPLCGDLRFTNFYELFSDVNAMVNSVVHRSCTRYYNVAPVMQTPGRLSITNTEFNRFESMCSAFFDDVDELRQKYPQCSQFQLLVMLAYVPEFHRLALRAKLVQQALLSINKQVGSQLNILSLPDRFGFYTTPEDDEAEVVSLYSSIGFDSLNPLSGSYQLLLDRDKEEVGNRLGALVERFNSVVRYLTTLSTIDKDVRQLLQTVQLQDKLLTYTHAVQQLTTLLSLAFFGFDEKASVFERVSQLNRAVRTLASEKTAGASDNELFGSELRQIDDALIRDNGLFEDSKMAEATTYHNLATIHLQLLHFLSKGLDTFKQQHDLCRVEGIFQPLVVPYQHGTVYTPLANNLITNRQALNKHIFNTTISGIARQFDMAGFSEFVLSDTLIELLSLDESLLPQSLAVLGQRDAKTPLHVISTVEECESTLVKFSTTALMYAENIFEHFDIQVSEQTKAFQRNTKSGTNELGILLQLAELATAGQFVTQFVKEFDLDAIFDANLGVPRAGSYQKLPLIGVLNEVLKKLQAEAYALQQQNYTNEQVHDAIKILVRDMQSNSTLLEKVEASLTEVEDKYSTDAEVVRIIKQVWQALDEPDNSIPTLKHILAIAGELADLSYSVDELQLASRLQDAVQAACSLVKRRVDDEKSFDEADLVVMLRIVAGQE